MPDDDDIQRRDEEIEDRKVGPGTGPTAETEETAEEARKEGGSPGGGDPRTAAPAGTGRPRLDDHDLEPDDIDEEGRRRD